jgi:hypothetical protein
MSWWKHVMNTSRQRPFNMIKTASLYPHECYQIEGWPRPNAQVVRAEVLCLPVLYVRIYRTVQYWKVETSALTTWTAN